MQWRCLMLGLSLLVGSLTPATSFVLHKRHAPSKDDNSENRLSQALNVIARERRRLRDDDTWRSPQEPYPSDQGEYDRYDDRAVQQLLASLLEGGLPQGYENVEDGYGQLPYPEEGFDGMRDPEEGFEGMRDQDGGFEGLRRPYFTEDNEFGPSYAEGAFRAMEQPQDIEDEADGEEDEQEEQPQVQPTSDDELQEIFQPSDEEGEEETETEEGGEEEVEKKDVMPIVPMVPMVPGQKRGGEEEEELSPEQVRQLLEDAENQIPTVSEEADPQDIEDILSEDEAANEEADMRQGEGQDITEDEEAEENDVMPDDVIMEHANYMRPENKEWPLEEYLAEGERVHVKRKRSGRDPDISSMMEVQLDRDELQLENSMLRKYLDFEDDQNEKLMQALDLATKGQLSETDRYIGAEVDLIKEAIGDEEMLQMMRQSLDEDDLEEAQEGPLVNMEESADLEEPLAEVLGEEDEMVPFLSGITDREIEPRQTRRSPGFLDDDDEELLDEETQRRLAKRLAEQLFSHYHPAEVKRSQAVETYPDSEELDEQTQRAMARRLAAQLYTQLWQQNMAAQDDVMQPEDDVIDEGEPGEWYDRPFSEDMEGVDDREDDINPLLNDLWRRYEEEQAARYPDDAEEPYVEDPRQEPVYKRTSPDASCPSLAMTDGCTWTYSERLMLDSEARDLCARHQMCYLCGSAHGLTEEDCDEGFTSEADSDCTDNQDECEQQILDLYGRMRRHHGYVPAGLTHHTCSYQCTASYIVGGMGLK